MNGLQDDERDADKERRVRERRREILMAGDGDTGLSEGEAHEIAYSESLADIYDQDGDHLADTDPELADWLREKVEKPDEDDEGDEQICPLCNLPIEPGDKTDEGEYGTVHHNCPDFLDDLI